MMLVSNISAVISFLLHRLCFSYKKCSDQRTYLKKDVWSTQLPGGVPLSGPLQPFCGPLAAIFNFAGGSQFLIKGVLRSKNLFRKNCSECPRDYDASLIRPCRVFLDHWWPFLILYAVSESSSLYSFYFLIFFYFLVVFLLSNSFIHQSSSFIMYCGIRTNRKWNYGHVPVLPFIFVS